MRSQSKNEKISRLGKKIIITVVITLLILGLVLLLMGRNYLKSSLKPLDSSNHRIVQVKIPVGASDRKIGSILQNRRVVRNGLMFSYYVKSRNVQNLKAGYYQLSPSMSLKRVSELLRIGGANRPISLKKRQLIIKPNEKTAKIISQLGCSGSQFKRLLSNHGNIHRLAKRYPDLKIQNHRTSLASYLAPGRYIYNPDNLKSLLNQMVNRTSDQLRNNKKRISRAHLTIPEAYRMTAYFNQLHLSLNEQRFLARLWLHNSASLHHVHFYMVKHNGKSVKRMAIDFNNKAGYESPPVTSVLAMLPNRKISSNWIYFTMDNTSHQIYGLSGGFDNLKNQYK